MANTGILHLSGLRSIQVRRLNANRVKYRFHDNRGGYLTKTAWIETAIMHNDDMDEDEFYTTDEAVFYFGEFTQYTA